MVENDVGTDEGEVGEFITWEEEELARPKMITFKVNTRTTGSWFRADVEWEVSMKMVLCTR